MYKLYDENDEKINAEVIGFFKISETNKEYIIYGLTDNKEEYILIGEVVKDGDKIHILGINDDERQMVMDHYSVISKQVGDLNV